MDQKLIRSERKNEPIGLKKKKTGMDRRAIRMCPTAIHTVIHMDHVTIYMD